MFTNSSFEATAKAMKANAEKFNPATSKKMFEPVMENFKAWADLAQKQVQVAQSAIAETVEAFKGVEEPQAAFEAMKASAENGIAIAITNLKDVTAMGVAHFNSGVDAIEKAHPAREVFASIGKGMKSAASAVENALDSAAKSGTAAVKKARGT